jgi:hypothetical protein
MAWVVNQMAACLPACLPGTVISPVEFFVKKIRVNPVGEYLGTQKSCVRAMY